MAGLAWVDEWLEGRPAPGAALQALLGAETLPPGSAIFFILVIVSAMAAAELAAILRANNITASTWVTCVSALFGLCAAVAAPSTRHAELIAPLLATAVVLVLLLSVVYYTRRRTVDGVVAATGGALLAFVYIGILISFLLMIRQHHSAWVVLGVLLLTKSCDIGAYFTGRAIGRRKLIVWLSPGKTWEGFFGGIALAMLLGAVAAWLTQWTETTLALWQGALAGAVFAVLGQAGDLIASLLKRDAGIKDSSRALPGFGGVLDVLDSPLLVAPAAYWLLLAFMRG
ncbi:MAG: hypothetical protein EA376_12015 [Phycisphaeraceae bacterium]|nr:MAG: hypothetical protein EA376_12015 [Phycisphaeraceae bacterium]